MTEKEIIDALQTALSTEGIDTIPEKGKEDFRKFCVMHICLAEESEERCLRFSPGPSGQCSYKKESETYAFCLDERN